MLTSTGTTLLSLTCCFNSDTANKAKRETLLFLFLVNVFMLFSFPSDVTTDWRTDRDPRTLHEPDGKREPVGLGTASPTETQRCPGGCQSCPASAALQIERGTECMKSAVWQGAKHCSSKQLDGNYYREIWRGERGASPPTVASLLVNVSYRKTLQRTFSSHIQDLWRHSTVL